MKNRSIIQLVLKIPMAFTLALGAASCGGSDSEEATKLTGIIPKLAISSPTLATSSTAARFFSVEGDAESETPKTLSEKEAETTAILAKETVEECFQDFELKTYSPSVDCFGPSLAFLNHPGGAMSGPAAPDCPSGASCLPTNDLGIWEATTSSGEACAAAKMNGLTEEVATAVDNALSLAARVVCVAQVNKVEMPSSDEATSLTDYLTDVWPDATFDKAELAQLSSVGGMSVYQTTLDVTYQDARIYIVIVNSPLILTGGEKGRVFGFVDFLDGTDILRRGFSVVYSRSNDDLTYLLRSAVTPNTEELEDLFDVSGENFDYDYSAFLAGVGSGYRDARYILANVSRETGLGVLKFVWQAGASDQKARVFHVKTQEGTSGAKDSGFAYYGYGPKFGSLTGVLGEIGGMCCNWAGPGGTCSADETTYDKSGKGQSQYFERYTAGTFAPTSSTAKNNIAYAPTTSCEYTTGSNFIYATAASWTGSETDHASVLSSGSDWLTAVTTIPASTTGAAGTIDWTVITVPEF